MIRRLICFIHAHRFRAVQHFEYGESKLLCTRCNRYYFEGCGYLEEWDAFCEDAMLLIYGIERTNL